MSVINPRAITDYNRSEADLQRFWTFCVIVAGKNADWASHKVGQLYEQADERGQLPFDYLRENKHALHNVLVVNRVGQYARIERALTQSLDLDLRECDVRDLEKVFGVGPKTARFFLLHSRPNVEVAVLDTHVLRWLRTKLCIGAASDLRIPESTPSQPLYGRLENICLRLMAAEFPGMSFAQADLLVWCQQSGRLEDDWLVSIPTLPNEEVTIKA